MSWPTPKHVILLLSVVGPTAGCSGNIGGNDGNGRDGGGSVADAGPQPRFDAGAIDGFTFSLEVATPEQIGLYLVVHRSLSDASRVTIRYKRASEQTWQTGHPLLRIVPDWVAGGAPQPPVDSFAGTIFDLSPGTDYDVELTLEEPGRDDQIIRAPASTRALPPPSAPATVVATPEDDLQSKLDGLVPGDVLELAEGTYDVAGLHLASSGTETQPITIRGSSREGVVLRNPGIILQLQDTSYAVIENLTLRGAGVDSGTAATSVGVSFWSGAAQHHVTLRGLDIVDVDKGIVASGPVRSVLVYDSVLRGNNVWNEEFLHSNLTWNDDGIRLPGEGNCAFENTLHGFGDTLAVADGIHSAAVYYYRNRITMTGDDAFEADYGTRNLGFYDNYVTNAGTLLSLDPVWGGPLYCFRNVAVNTFRGPFKLNNTNSGFMIYNNTIIRTEGRTGWGWVQFNNGALRGWSFRNNVLVYRGGTGRLLAVESSGNDPIDFTHNAWFPDGSIWWTYTGGSYSSLGAARTALSPTQPLFGTSAARHESDVLTESNPFVSMIPLGPDHLTEIATDTSPALHSDASPKNAGVAIPNITDGYSGAAPDMGAIIDGRPPPRWGATRP